jgi:hypothetical protein
MMNVMTFNNVSLNNDTERFVNAHTIARDRVNAHPMLEPVIEKLAVLYPLWRFEGSGHQSLTNQGTLWLTHFDVSCDGESLGTISRRYEGRDYQICVRNDRIKSKLERSDFYKTMSADKAIAKVKKMFGPKDVQERTELSREIASSAAQNAEWSKNREKGEAEDIVKRAAHKYVMGVGFQSFMEHVKDHYPAQEYNLLLTKHEVATQAAEDLRTINKVRDVLAHRAKGAVVTRRGSTYVVEQNDKAEICDDNTLPEWVRNRIGMLKLIEPGQFVSDLGMKVNADTFVIIEPDLTTVTEGETK